MQLEPSLTIYLLHFDVPLGNVRHYLGITHTARLAARLREHAHQRGSSLTARLAQRNTDFAVVKTWADVQWADERKLKRKGRYHQHCLLCQGSEPCSPLPRIPCPDLIHARSHPLFITMRGLVDD